MTFTLPHAVDKPPSSPTWTLSPTRHSWLSSGVPPAWSFPSAPLVQAPFIGWILPSPFPLDIGVLQIWSQACFFYSFSTLTLGILINSHVSIPIFSFNLFFGLGDTHSTTSLKYTRLTMEKPCLSLSCWPLPRGSH